MSTKFFCKNERCAQADRGPFVLELPQEAVMDGNNLATIFCPRCGQPMQPLPAGPQDRTDAHRFYCHNDRCRSNGNDLFYIDLPEEAIMDKNNMATIFCPKCGKTMRSFGQGTTAAVNY